MHFYKKWIIFSIFFSKSLCSKKIIHNFAVKTYLSLNIYAYEKNYYFISDDVSYIHRL